MEIRRPQQREISTKLLRLAAPREERPGEQLQGEEGRTQPPHEALGPPQSIVHQLPVTWIGPDLTVDICVERDRG